MRASTPLSQGSAEPSASRAFQPQVQVAFAAMSSTTHSPLAGSLGKGPPLPLHVELVLSCSTLILASPPVRNLPAPPPNHPHPLGNMAPFSGETWWDATPLHEPYRVIPKICLFKKEEETLANLLLSGHKLLWL